MTEKVTADTMRDHPEEAPSEDAAMAATISEEI